MFSEPSHRPHAQDALFELLLGGWRAQVISALTRLGVPDALERRQEATAAELVEMETIDADVRSLERLLRAGAACGVLTESAGGRFGRTELSALLSADSPHSLSAVAATFGGTWWRIWGTLPDAVSEGRARVESVLGMDYWSYCRSNPAEAAGFFAALAEFSRDAVRNAAALCDLSGVQSIVDVGGGTGQLAAALLHANPHLRAIVFDTPDVVAFANATVRDAALRERLSFEAGDMREAVPASQVYFLKHIIHDWDDETAVAILGSCRRHLPPGGRVYCLDAVLPEFGETGAEAAKLMDLNMLVSLPGCERRLEEWSALLGAAGLTLVSARPLEDRFFTHLIEARS